MEHQTHTDPTDRHRLVFYPAIELIADGNALWQTPEPHLDHTQEQRNEAIHQALTHALTEKQREAIWLHFFEGLSQGEIARKLGVSQQVIQKRIYGTCRDGRMIGGALRKLRDALAHLFPSPPTQSMLTSPNP